MAGGLGKPVDAPEEEEDEGLLETLEIEMLDA